MGAKAVSIYRDGSKRTQPLNTSKRQRPTADGGGGRRAGPMRRKLPDERHAITHKFDIAGHEGYITVGLFEDGKPGEIFLVMAKEGSTISGLCRRLRPGDLATRCSTACRSRSWWTSSATSGSSRRA